MEHLVACSISGKSLDFEMQTNLWFVTVNEQKYQVGDDNDQSVLAVLPFLEIPVSEIQDRIKTLQKKCHNVRFPYDTLIHAGFFHGSPHWTDCALGWLVELGEMVSISNFTKELEGVVQNKKKYSQKSRQLAKRMLRLAIIG